MIFKIINYFRNLFRVAIPETSVIPNSENDDSDFDEHGYVKSQEALLRRKKKLQEKWLLEMPEVLEKYQSANALLFQKYNEESTRFQIYMYTFDFFDLSEVLVLDGVEIEYAIIKEVEYYNYRTWGPDYVWVDSYLCIEIHLEDNRNFTIRVLYDPYNVSHNILNKLLEIEKRNRK